jgi:predicted PurR-regulated permease PerM
MIVENVNKQVENDLYYERVVAAALKIGFVSLLFVLSYLILKPFLIMVLWGIIIAIGIYPIFRKLSSLLGDRDKLATTIITLTLLGILIVPSVLLIDSTIGSIQNIAAEYEAGTLKIAPPSSEIAEWPVVGKPVYETWRLASVNLEEALRKLEPQIREYGPKIVNAVAGLGGTILLSIISIIIAGALLLKSDSGEKTAQKVFTFLLGKDGEGFTNLASSTICSVVQGILGIAIIQAVTSGIVLLLFGIPAAGLWALIVLFLAIIQLPPILILLPISIYGFSVLDTTSAIIFLVLSIIISGSDTFLKPMFLGRGVDVPMLVILLGAIGGMMAFGILGLFVGAVILALAYKVFQTLISQEK